jgi:hypothetical protein
MMNKKAMLWSRDCKILATMVLLTAAAGCGQKAATISGKVTFQEVPITTGTIAFISQNGKVFSGNIEEGKYTVTGVEVGPDATVTVMSHVPSPMMQPPTGPIAGVPNRKPLKYVPIPDRYGDPKRSGLSCQVMEGAQTCDFAL